ncbi:bifunctional adenosylcobinamide kinase/adenosylcobinamide-phosphate guanylyltransferase [Fictibacillus fluitans]|uniref:Bifunctional adenosylcobinamide kinase/adenosylcobinamide-phosphate guanylyltransferase n=1 Tax=Fictibacillus fluitans TaxID=3058422 RepID=A0ABT8HYA3_9BACL|nr:bifunctional adenosylcobinamide kinase/adenosylcobinamide-phosphate guanylyltransferase [Fictibacillus sp. NE201]MDN4525760.1 bifunctional adenosylcobinamide kinase/adenosylcobinamide-phosphate guanylyltransferase [Fictibacillus sp. NE201]
MHFVTGGAFHGKAKWVMKTYSASRNMEGWFNLYEAECPETDQFETSLVVLEGMEQLVKKVVQENKKGTREVLQKKLQSWLEWESDVRGRRLVLIGTDIGKGIVPMEEENRRWRDVSGWFFQDTAMAAERVNIVWYGLEQTIK